MEIWKDIYFIEKGIEYDYRGLYKVSNYGRVKSLGNDKTKKEKILKARKNTYGYERVVLCKNSKQKDFQVHRLVAHMFIKGYFEGAEVNHIDENAENNHISNLEWCTREYNVNYGTRNKRAGESHKGKTLSEEHKRKLSESHKGKLIARYDLNMNLIDIKYNFEYFQMGFERQNIASCCNGKRKTHKGFVFKYYEGDI